MIARFNAWAADVGLDQDRVKRRALAGVVIGLAVVFADRMLGLGS